MNSTGRSKKTKTKNKRQIYTVTLERTTPIECTFEVEADSVEDAIEKALTMDWDDYSYGPADGCGDEYCTGILDAAGKELAVPPKYSFDAVNKENN